MYNDDTGTMDSLGNITYVRENSEIEDVGEYYEVLDANVSNPNPNYKIIIRKGNFYILPTYSGNLYNSTKGLYNLCLYHPSLGGGVQTDLYLDMENGGSVEIPFEVNCAYDPTDSKLSIVAVKDTVSSEERTDYKLYVDNTSLFVTANHGSLTKAVDFETYYTIEGYIILEVEDFTNEDEQAGVNNIVHFLMSLDENPTVEYMAEGKLTFITK